MKMIVRAGLICAVLSALVAPAAMAQTGGWAVQDVGKGCKIVLSNDELQPPGTTPATFPLTNIEWLGKCGANGLATGIGTLTIDHQLINAEQPAQNRADRRTYKFTAVNGVIDGPVTWSHSVRYPGKAWVDAESEAAKINVFDTKFRNGCEAGQAEAECDPASALAARADYLSEKGLAAPAGNTKSVRSVSRGPNTGTSATSDMVPNGQATKAPSAPVISDSAGKSPSGQSSSGAVEGSYPFSSNNVLNAMERLGEPALAGTSYASGYTLKHRDGAWNMDLSSCERSGACKALQINHCFTANYASEAKANNWNNSQFFGRAFVNSAGRVCIDSTLQSADGTTSDQTLGHFIRTFKTIREQATAFFSRP